MAGFTRRFTRNPTITELQQIEAIDIVDLTPPAPTNGIGTGTLITVGEYEDGPFAAGGDSAYWDYQSKGKGPQEVFTSADYRNRFGGFGFAYDGVQYLNPCARRHLTEDWNGSGFIKNKFLRPSRLILARVDTSVGQVAFNMLASITGGAGPFALTVGQQMSVTTDVGGPAASTALAAVVASHTGVAGTFPTLFAGGETLRLSIENGPEFDVVFAAADQTNAQVVARINSAFGQTIADLNGGQVRISGIFPGTASRVVVVSGSAGVLTTLGLTAATYSGTGNVGNINAVTATELATLLSATAAWIANGATATVDANGNLRVQSDTPGTGTVTIIAGAMATALGFETGVVYSAGEHDAGFIMAGTRVRTAGGTEWVTMQTLSIPEGTSASPVGGPFLVKVRPATDDGTGLTQAAGTVVVVADQPDFGQLACTNPSALTAALTEVQMDVAYQAAFDATINPNSVVREANFIISARQSDQVRAVGRQNALDASSAEHFGRKFIAGAPIGFSESQAIAQVATLRSDRLFYTWPGWQVYIPEIAAKGTAGGTGFTADGIITVRADGPLASINCQLPPEENPGQRTDLIAQFFDVEETASPLQMADYIALKAAGICAPRVDRVSGPIYQSGVTSVDPDNDPGLVTQARRKMADFIQDTLAQRMVPLSKKLNTAARRDAIRAIIDQFLSELQSSNAPDLQRIESYSVDEVSGNTPEMSARGIFVVIIQVRTLSSLDAIVLQTEIGEGVTIQAA